MCLVRPARFPVLLQRVSWGSRLSRDPRSVFQEVSSVFLGYLQQSSEVAPQGETCLGVSESYSDGCV